MRLSPENYQKAVDRLNKPHRKLYELEPRVGILATGLNPMLVNEAEKLEQANKEKRSWEKVTQGILFNHI